MGRGLAALGFAPGDEVTEQQLRNLFEATSRRRRSRPAPPWTPGETVTEVDLGFRPQPTIYLLWALGMRRRGQVIEAAHEYAIERVLEWIEDEVAVTRYGKNGIYQVRPPGSLVPDHFRHHEARSGRPLLHDHLLLWVKGQRLDGSGARSIPRPCTKHRARLRPLQRDRGLRGAGAGDRVAGSRITAKGPRSARSENGPACPAAARHLSSLALSGCGT